MLSGTYRKGMAPARAQRRQVGRGDDAVELNEEVPARVRPGDSGRRLPGRGVRSVRLDPAAPVA